MEVAREEKQKREDIGERWKTKAMAAKCQRAREGNSLCSEEKENYKSDIRDKTDPEQADNNKNPLQLSEASRKKRGATQLVDTL